MFFPPLAQDDRRRSYPSLPLDKIRLCLCVRVCVFMYVYVYTITDIVQEMSLLNQFYDRLKW